MRIARVASLSILVVTISLCNQAVSNQLLSDDPALHEAKRRQEGVKTAEITFEQQEIIPAGGMSQFSPGATHKSVPVQETRLSSKNRLLIDGRQVRYEKNHPVWSEVTHTFKDYHVISILNTSSASQWYPNGMGESGRSTGVIMRNRKNPDLNMYVLLPITFSFRGIDPAIIAYPITRLVRTSKTTRVRSQECIEYTLILGKDQSRVYYLAPKLKYQLVRMQTINKGKVLNQLDVDYREHVDIGAVPSSWTRVDYTAAGMLWRSSTVKLTQLLINESIAPKAFVNEFPPQTLVYDQNTDTDYKVQDDGTMQPISPTGQELGIAIPQPGTPWYRRFSWLSSILAGAVVLLLVFSWIRWTRGRSLR
jgi:hypothetical protein